MPYFAIWGKAGDRDSRNVGSYAGSEEECLRAREVMFASESQSPVITSTGSEGCLEARERRACRRSEALPDVPVGRRLVEK
jgi:hypothetical protein